MFPMEAKVSLLTQICSGSPKKSGTVIYHATWQMDWSLDEYKKIQIHLCIFLLVKFIHLGSKGRLALSRYWTSVDRECMFGGESGGSFELTATYAS